MTSGAVLVLDLITEEIAMGHVYVGTYGKYVSGSTEGAWLDLDDYADKEEFLKACQDLHGPGDHEFMFQDHVGVPSSFITESSISKDYWEWAEDVAINHLDEEATKAFISLFGYWSLNKFQDLYRGEWESWADMAENLVEELGLLANVPWEVEMYFDYDAYARDLRLSGDYVQEDGYFFING